MLQKSNLVDIQQIRNFSVFSIHFHELGDILSFLVHHKRCHYNFECANFYCHGHGPSVCHGYLCRCIGKALCIQYTNEKSSSLKIIICNRYKVVFSVRYIHEYIYGMIDNGNWTHSLGQIQLSCKLKMQQSKTNLITNSNFLVLDSHGTVTTTPIPVCQNNTDCASYPCSDSTYPYCHVNPQICGCASMVSLNLNEIDRKIEKGRHVSSVQYIYMYIIRFVHVQVLSWFEVY